MEKIEKPNIKILVCCHKPGEWISDDIYIPIQCGKALSNVDLAIQGDDTGDNISTKNRNYAELTAMYWAWKNMKNVDYIGLCHYRRYFDFHKQSNGFGAYTERLISSIQDLEYSIPNTVFSQIEKGHIIVASPFIVNTCLYLNYCYYHISDDLRVLEDVLRKRNDIYYKSFLKLMWCNNRFFPCNMFLMPFVEYDKYCTWLFDVLSEVESRLDISKYTSDQSRVFAYMAERLLTVYLYANHIKTKGVHFVWFNNSSFPKRSWFRVKLSNFVSTLSLLPMCLEYRRKKSIQNNI